MVAYVEGVRKRRGEWANAEGDRVRRMVQTGRKRERVDRRMW